MASVRGWLWAYHARYAPFFSRRERRGYLHDYLQGLIGMPHSHFAQSALLLDG